MHIDDEKIIEMLFDSSNRLTTIRKYSKASVIYTTIVYNDNGSITITDGMGRSVSVTSSAIDTAMLTYSNGDLTQIADSAGETVNYTYDSANNLATITANGQSVAFTYDSNRRVTQILYKIGSNQIKKQLLTYADSVTQVKEIKYPDKGSVAYTITCYKFDVEGNLITTFEKDNTEASEKILKTKYFSPDPYENYVLNLNGKESDSGMYYQNNGDDVVGYFQDPPTANAGEQYVLFAMLDREKLFSGISNGHLEIWLEDGTGDVENLPMHCLLNTQSCNCLLIAVPRTCFLRSSGISMQTS